MSTRKRIPKYRKHSSRNRGFVELDSKRIYLDGAYGSDESRQHFDRIIGDWLANRPVDEERVEDQMTVSQLALQWQAWSKTYYPKNSQYDGVKSTVKILRKLFGDLPASKLGPRCLRRLQEYMIAKDYSRRYINETCSRTKRCYRWAVVEEMVEPIAYERLKVVPGLDKRRSQARESKPVMPVADSVVDATLPHLPELVADMVRLQRLTGARPIEICLMRKGDIDRSGEVWLYTPERHKTEHHGKRRIIAIGPQAQEVLRPYLLRSDDTYCFPPAESDRRRRAKRTEERQTPLSCGNRPGTNRLETPREFRDRYDTSAYRRAIHRACDKAEVTRWSPNQLRHAAATAIRKEFDLEAAATVLGHAKMDVTEIYALRNIDRAKEIAKAIG